MLEKITTLLYLSGDSLPLQKVADMLSVQLEDITKEIPRIIELLSPLGLTIVITEKEIAIVTKPEMSSLAQTFRKEELKGDLTPATLQVLTLVAYMGEISKEDISYIRGVQSAQSVRTLLVRGFITKQGEMCSLTIDALQYLGITKKEDLPNYEHISSSFKQLLSKKNDTD